MGAENSNTDGVGESMSTDSTSTTFEPKSNLRYVWSDEEIEYMMYTIIVVSLVTIMILYYFRPFFKTGSEGDDPARNQNLITEAQVNRTGDENSINSSMYDAAGVKIEDNPDYDVLSGILKNTRYPPHHHRNASSNELSHEGVLPFRKTRASTFETGYTDRTLKANKIDRARVFARLFSRSRARNSQVDEFAPPPRGSNIVISIPQKDIGCIKLARVLYLLGSYYNLFLLLHVDKEEGQRDSKESSYISEKNRINGYIKILRCYQSDLSDAENSIDENSAPQKQYSPSPGCKAVLREEVLPAHRIIATTTGLARVAFVRQFPTKPKFILDFDHNVKDQLERFNFTVLLYSTDSHIHQPYPNGLKPTDDKNEKTTTVVSGIGAELLPLG